MTTTFFAGAARQPRNRVVYETPQAKQQIKNFLQYADVVTGAHGAGRSLQNTEARTCTPSVIENYLPINLPHAKPSGRQVRAGAFRYSGEAARQYEADWESYVDEIVLTVQNQTAGGADLWGMVPHHDQCISGHKSVS